MIKHKDQRVGVFIDVSNMYHSAKNLYGTKVNFQEVLRVAVAGRLLIRASAYVVKSQSSEESVFFEALDKQGFEVKTKDLQVFFSGAKKADWDVGIAVDAIKMADKLDVIVLVTGDGDFIPLVLYLKENKGCLVEVIGFGRTTSSKLREACDGYIDIDENQKCLIKPKLLDMKRPSKQKNPRLHSFF
ncbi:MAG: hypothetical protein US74_C0028G0009 [Parcubacteria group bacterium GW2011_GWA2_38_13]|nr:MAG: hypothetical protein US74_C0028G0009 [Parcubacteria group bacterium GW2011_GWA2_38_13]